MRLKVPGLGKLVPNLTRVLLPKIQDGVAPGTAVYVGSPREHQIQVDQIAWSQTELSERSDLSDKEALKEDTFPVNWYDVNGIHDAKRIERLGLGFELHPLSIEDVLNPSQRPKVEHYDEYVYLVLKMVYLRPPENGATEPSVNYEQVSLFLGEDFVLTFQEFDFDVFDGVRDRLRKGDSRIRRRKADYAAYTLMDAVVDNYVLVLEELSGRVETMEEAIMGNDATIPPRLHALRRQLLTLRKAVWPLREAVQTLTRDDNQWIDSTTQPYLRDLYDHLLQVVESIDIYRDVVSSLLDLHISMAGNRMNEEMRVLTVIATIFIPLTFVAGVYGMNFEHMPELKWEYGYAYVWAVMGGLAVLMGLFFRFRRRF